MTRIIAGNLGSLRLKPAAKVTRPTADRVKESVFSKLESMDVIEDARVLDLFAGTGALGLEAISRGASTLTLVEKNTQALSVLKSNVQLVQESLVKQNIAVKISISHSDAGKFLLGVTPKSFDLVFVDPPYELSDSELHEIIQKLLSSMAGGAVLVVERSAKSDLLEVEGLELFDEKLYGDTKVWFYRKP